MSKNLKTLPRNILYWTLHLLMEEGDISYLKRVNTINDYQKLQDEIAYMYKNYNMYKNYKKNETKRLDKCKK